MSDVALEMQVGREWMGVVYGAALRQVRGDAGLAEEVVQVVMMVMVEKGRKRELPEEKFMAGWLVKVTYFAVKSAERARRRRLFHEGQAGRERVEREEGTAEERERVMGCLDEAMMKLGTLDREVVVRRYLRGESLASVGAVVGMEENSVGRRVQRAVEKLRGLMEGLGVVVSSAVVMKVMEGQGGIVAPSGVGISAGTAQVKVAAKQVIWRLFMAKVKIGLMAGGVVLSLVIGAAVGMRALAGTGGARVPVVAATQGEVKVLGEVEVKDTEALKEATLKGIRGLPAMGTLYVAGAWTSAVFDVDTKRVRNGEMEWMKAWADFRGLPTYNFYAKGIMFPYPFSDRNVVEQVGGAQVWRIDDSPYAKMNGTFHHASDLMGGAFCTELLGKSNMANDAKRGVNDSMKDFSAEALADKAVTVREVILAGDRPAVEVTVAFTGDLFQWSKGETRRYWLDEKKGYALIAKEVRWNFGGSIAEWVVEEVKEISPGVFYPMKAHWHYFGGAEDYASGTFTGGEVEVNGEEPAALKAQRIAGEEKHEAWMKAHPDAGIQQSATRPIAPTGGD